jgi:serine/threonine protein phosphatase 1
MVARTIAVGDIHGCAKALDALIDAVDPVAEDRLILLGDYIDRGPDSRGVVDRVLDLEGRCQLITLMGNHELMLLEALEQINGLSFWLSYGGQQTVDSYGGQLDSIPADHLDFLRRCRFFYETDSHLFVHANYQHDLPLDRQPPLTLFWTHLTTVVPLPHVSGKTAVVGHTPQFSGEIVDLGHLLCIDTFCYGGRWLTALDVENRTIWQASPDGKLRRA